MRMEMIIIIRGISIITMAMEMAIKKIASTKTPSNNNNPNSHKKTSYHTILAILK